MSDLLELTEENFAEKIATGVVAVDFWASWCGPCRMLAPVLEQVSLDVADKATVAKVNIEDHKNLAIKYEVRTIPTIIIFKDGLIVEQLVGVQSRGKIVDLINKHTN